MEEQTKKRVVTSLEQLVSPDRTEPKPKAVTQSPKKKAKRDGGDAANGEPGDQKKPEVVVDTVAENLSSVLNEAKDIKSEAKSEISETKSDDVTAETVMGFPSHPNKTNKEMVMENPGFIRWARGKKNSGNVYGNLQRFLEWLDTPEGQLIELGSEKYGGGGQHAGKTFEQIARSDPGYHIRYMSALKSNGKEPNEKLTRYISFFEKFGNKLKPDLPNGNRTTNRTFRMGYNELGNQRIAFGQHRGKTYRWVARNDPSYHLRYMEMNPGVALQRLKEYIEYFDEYGDEYAALAHHREELASHAGAYLPF